MTITQSDFINWKQDEVTKVFFGTVNVRIYEKMAELTGFSRSDMDQVNWNRGYIQALNEILETAFDEVQENDTH